MLIKTAQVGQVFRTKHNGKYVIGLGTSLGAAVLAVAGHVTLYFYLRRENRRRESLSPQARQAEIDAGLSGDFHPDYRYAL